MSSSKGKPANMSGVYYGPPLGGKVEAPDVDSVHKQELVDERSGEFCCDWHLRDTRFDALVSVNKSE